MKKIFLLLKVDEIVFKTLSFRSNFDYAPKLCSILFWHRLKWNNTFPPLSQKLAASEFFSLSLLSVSYALSENWKFVCEGHLVWIYVTFPTVIYNRGKVLESAQEISKISRCFVLWEPWNWEYSKKSYSIWFSQARTPHTYNFFLARGHG